MTEKILIVEDENHYQQLYKRYLNDNNYQIQTANSSETAREVFASFKPQIVLLDLCLEPEGEEAGFNLLEAFTTSKVPCKVIILTSHNSEAHAKKALDGGAYEFLQKDQHISTYLPLRIKNALTAWQLEHKPQALSSNLNLLAASSPSMQEVVSQLAQLAASQQNILILGESGTGKSLIAKIIHQSGLRSYSPFTGINCHMPSTLVESELFGYKKGAFTDARQDKKGKLKAADKGTLFLDEIGLMPVDTQAKLLTVVDSGNTKRYFTPLGSTTEEFADVRIICATNTNLQQQVQKGEFREDLFHRLNTVILNIPPLRERKADIAELAQNFLQQCLEVENRFNPQEISSDSLERLKKHDWPGNVRELKNIIHRAVVFSRSNYLMLSDIENSLKQSATAMPPQDSLLEPHTTPKTWKLKDIETQIKHQHLQKCLEHTNQDMDETCKLLDISRRHLSRLLKEFELE